MRDVIAPGDQNLVFGVIYNPGVLSMETSGVSGGRSPSAPSVVVLCAGLRGDIGGVGNVAGGALYTGLHLSVFLSFAFDAQAEDNRRARMSRARMFSFTQCHKSSAYAFLIIIGKVHTLN
jgi:hypothetical protein